MRRCGNCSAFLGGCKRSGNASGSNPYTNATPYPGEAFVAGASGIRGKTQDSLEHPRRIRPTVHAIAQQNQMFLRRWRDRREDRIESVFSVQSVVKIFFLPFGTKWEK